MDGYTVAFYRQTPIIRSLFQNQERKPSSPQKTRSPNPNTALENGGALTPRRPEVRADKFFCGLARGRKDFGALRGMRSDSNVE